MAKKCEICEKKVEVGNNVSHANNRNKRTFKPNLQKIRIKINGTVKRVNVCTKCLKSGKVTKVVS